MPKKPFITLASIRHANEQIIQDAIIHRAGRTPVRDMPTPTAAQCLLSRGKFCTPHTVDRANETLIQHHLIRKAGRIPLPPRR